MKNSRTPLVRTALIAAATLGFAAAGVAQEIPEGQSCGGLVCDLGLFGHKTAPKPAVAVPAEGSPVPPPVRSAAKPEAAAEAKRPAHKKAHVAKAASVRAAAVAKPGKAEPTAATVGVPPVASSLVPAPAAAPSPSQSPVATALAPPPSFAVPEAAPAPPPPAPIPVTATPNEPVVLANPYVYNKPLKFMFQSVDPTQGVQ